MCWDQTPRRSSKLDRKDSTRLSLASPFQVFYLSSYYPASSSYSAFPKSRKSVTIIPAPTLSHPLLHMIVTRIATRESPLHGGGDDSICL